MITLLTDKKMTDETKLPNDEFAKIAKRFNSDDYDLIDVMLRAYYLGSEQLQQKLQAADQQTAELQQEVERLKAALEQCKGLTTWGTKDATHVFNQIDKIASKALNPQQDENGR